MDADCSIRGMYSDIIAKFEDGYEVISMIRTKNADAGIIKRITSGAFYKVLNLMSRLNLKIILLTFCYQQKCCRCSAKRL